MASPLVSDVLWSIIAPLLPVAPPRPRGGKPRVSDRAALTGILFVLRTGIQWEMLPLEMGCGSGITCWRRLRDWQEASVWDGLHRALLRRLRAADRIDWSRACLDSASPCCQKGGDKTGPNPTDRGRFGTKRRLITDRNGLPLAFVLTGANTTIACRSRNCSTASRRSMASVAGHDTGRTSSTPTGLRPSTLLPGLPPSRDRTRIARRGVETSQKRPIQVGHRAHLRLDQPLPQARHTLRAQKRHPPRLHRPRVLAHLPQPIAG